MTKQEFLEGLRRALLSTGSESLIRENMNFYSSYIDGEISKGRSLEEIMEELGDPRLIANSIKAAEGYDEEFTGNTLDDKEENGYEKEDYTEKRDNSRDSSSGGFKLYNFTGSGAVLIMLAVIAVLVLIIVVLAVVVGGILKLLSPILIPLMFAAVIIWTVKGISKR